MPKTANSKKQTVKSTGAKQVAKNVSGSAKAKAPAKKPAEKVEATVKAKVEKGDMPVLTKSPARGASAPKKSVKADVVDTKGKVVESLSLPGVIFAAKVNPVLMSQAVRVYLANQRQGSAATKSRGEVRATTAKVWRQKGTGRARHGARSAPIFVGGGVAHGPKPVDHSLTLSKKMRRLSLFSALTTKLQDKELLIVTGLEKLPPKTKEMAAVFEKLTVNTKKQKVLLVLPKGDGAKTLVRISRNIDGVTFTPVTQLTTYDVLNNTKVLFVKDAIATLEEHYGKKEAK